MSADATAARLQAKVAGGRLVLTGKDAGSAELTFLLDGTFGLDALNITDPRISVDGERLTLVGQAEILGVEQVDLTLALDYAGPTLSLTLNKNTLWPLGPHVALRPADLVFTKVKKGPWSASGEIKATFLDVALSLFASYERDGQSKRFRFRQALESPPLALALAPIGRLEVSAIEMRRSEEPAEGEAEPEVRWQFAGDGALRVTPIPDFSTELAGTVTVPPDGAESGIDFAADPADPRNRIALLFPVPDLASQPGMVVTPHSLRLERSGKDWTAQAAAGTEFHDMPAFLTQPVPGTNGRVRLIPQEPREWTLTITKKAVTLGIDRLWDSGGITAALPPLDRPGEAPLPLGSLWMDAVDWTVVMGKEPALQVTLRMVASDGLNRIFGVRPDGVTPILDFFRTYGPGEDPETLATGIALGISKKGVIAELLSSPFNYAQFEAPWWHVTLGNEAEGENFGKLRFKSPRFRYNGSAFAARGAYEIVEPLRLPLQPIKALLVASGLELMADTLPDSLPLAEIDLVDEDDNLNAAGFLQLVGATGLSPDLRQALNRVLAGVDTFLERTPGRFNDFLRFAPPERLDFDIEIAPGGVRLDVATSPPGSPRRKPVRLLMPSLDPVFGPELMGVELYRVSFGAMLGGSLGVLRLDAALERFDLVSLVLCQIAGGKLLDGRSAKQFRRRYDFGNLLALMPTAAPVPLPIFYDDIGISYRGWDGLEFETHWGFPEPEVGFLESIDLIRALYRFIAEPDFVFDPDKAAPGGLDLPYVIGPNYIRLPKHLGGKMLGSDSATEGRLWRSIANLLDGFKTGEIAYFLGVIPVQARVAACDCGLGPFSIHGGFAVTTPREFTGPAGAEVRDLLASQLGSDPDTRLLEILPASSTSDEGLVLLLMGGFDIAGVIGFQGGFALAAVGESGTTQGQGGEPQPAGVATVVRFAGSIGLLEMVIEGGLGVSAEGVWIELTSSPLVWDGRALIEIQGRMEVGPNGFRVLVGLALNERFAIAGEFFIGKDRMEIGGRLTWRYAGDQALSAAAKAIFSKEGVGIAFQGHLYGCDCRFAGLLSARGELSCRAEIVLAPTYQDALKNAVIGIASDAEQGVNSALQDLERKIQDFVFEASLRGIRKTLPGLCDGIIRSIDSGINRGFRRWPSRKIFGRRVQLPGKSAALRSARRSARPHQNRLRRLRDQARKQDDKRFRAGLKAALLDIINHNRLEIRVRYLGTFYRRNLMNAKQIAQLRAAVEAVDLLPAKSNAKVAADAVYKKAVDRNEILGQVRSGIESGVEASVPRIEAVGFASGLGGLGSSVEIFARLAFRGESREVTADFDLRDPIGSTTRIAAAFTDDLAG